MSDLHRGNMTAASIELSQRERSVSITERSSALRESPEGVWREMDGVPVVGTSKSIKYHFSLYPMRVTQVKIRLFLIKSVSRNFTVFCFVRCSLYHHTIYYLIQIFLTLKKRLYDIKKTVETRWAIHS